MENLNLKKINKIFEAYPEIKLGYFFGSKANNNSGPLSDYDFAVYLHGARKQKMTDIKLELIDKLSRALKSDKIDVVVLNTTESPEIKYNIIKGGKLVYEKKPFKVLVEPRILNEYFDFRLSLSKYNLTKA